MIPRRAHLHTEFCGMCQELRPFAGRRCIVCRSKAPSGAKYGNTPTVSVTGHRRHSALEANHEGWLTAAQNAGVICELRAQVRFPLDLYAVPETERLLEAVEETGSAPLTRYCRELRRTKQHVCTYVADFTYKDEHGVLCVDDPKGFETREAKLKRRLMLLAHGVEVRLVKRAS